MDGALNHDSIVYAGEGVDISQCIQHPYNRRSSFPDSNSQTFSLPYVQIVNVAPLSSVSSKSNGYVAIGEMIPMIDSSNLSVGSNDSLILRADRPMSKVVPSKKSSCEEPCVEQIMLGNAIFFKADEPPMGPVGGYVTIGEVPQQLSSNYVQMGFV